MSFTYVTNVQPMLASGTRTSGGNTNAHNLGGAIAGIGIINVDTVVGTGSRLTVHFDTSYDNVTYYPMTWLGNAVIAKAGQHTFPITNFGKYLRGRYEITGPTSKSFTFDIKVIFKG